MYTLKRYFVFILCLCMSSYSLPVFAYALDSNEDISNKVFISTYNKIALYIRYYY